MLGLVAGSFDPLTRGHGALAAALREEGVDLVLFVYSPRTLAKAEDPKQVIEPQLLDEADRVAALLAYCERRERLGVAVCSHGLYVDQVEAAGAVFPGAEIMVGVGSDKVLQILDPVWYEDPEDALRRLFSRARVLYAVRRGDEERLSQALEAQPRWRSRLSRLELPEDVRGLSSRAVRRALRRGEDIALVVPEEVLPFLPGPGSVEKR
jgi:nicotinic acid mononucleotide adenylyltransferase